MDETVTVAEKKRATCPWCWNRYVLRKDGSLPNHSFCGDRCSGSEKKP